MLPLEPKFKVGDRVAFYSQSPWEVTPGRIVAIRRNMPRRAPSSILLEHRYVIEWEREASYGRLAEEIETWNGRLRLYS